MPFKGNYSLPVKDILTKVRSELELPEIIKWETDIRRAKNISN